MFACCIVLVQAEGLLQSSAAINFLSAGAVQEYEEHKARAYAALSAVGYCNDVASVENWSCKPCADGPVKLVPGKVQVVDSGKLNATRIVVGKLRDEKGCIMSFRGSKNTMNWLRNIEYWKVDPSKFVCNSTLDGDCCKGCRVHDGFYQIWKAVRAATVQSLREVGCEPNGENNLLYITGHSMGGALTHLAMFDFEDLGYDIQNSYTFEAPRIGNAQFSEAFSSRFSRKFPVFRITHHMDPVVHLPPEMLGFQNVETEVHYNETGGYKVCNGAEDKTCADQYSDLLDMIANHAGDHCSSSLVPNGNICYYCNGFPPHDENHRFMEKSVII